MLSKRPIKFGVTGPFVLFLIFVSIVPILLISGLFYKDIEIKFNERINNLLLLGMMVAEDTYKNDLETLEYSTRQAASFSISQAFQDYLANQDSAKFQKVIKRFQKVQNQEILVLFDNHQKMMFTSQPKVQLPSSARMVEKSLEGKTISGIERLYEPETQRYRLVYLSASPILSMRETASKHAANSKPLGVLLSGYSMSQHFSFKEILLIFPQLDIRILAKTPSGTMLYSSSSHNLGNLNAEQLQFVLKKATTIRHKPVPAMLNEESAGELYRTLAFPLLNTTGQAIGYIMMSSSESDFLQLKQKNILYVSGFLVLMGILIFFATYAFNRTIIRPVDELARISDIVAQGDLSIRVSDKQKLAEIQLMMQNFNKMLSELEESNMLRSTFVSTLTHDLRTPLFAQQRVLYAMEKVKHTGDAQWVEMLDAIEKGNTQLIEMVNKLLEAYQYESGRINIYPEKINLYRFVE